MTTNLRDEANLGGTTPIRSIHSIRCYICQPARPDSTLGLVPRPNLRLYEIVWDVVVNKVPLLAKQAEQMIEHKE